MLCDVPNTYSNIIKTELFSYDSDHYNIIDVSKKIKIANSILLNAFSFLF